MEIVNIKYKKVFLDGHLKGLAVDAGFPTSPDMVDTHVETLKNQTQENPGKELFTHNLY